ncbi:helix-turn-helix domain-containing protein [Acidovorax carolinensis]|uniref:helix-turn-helix domain-containing protein n=1 Tax=Acidovorax carolinensis TaxID=553814 RepID=UPI0012FF9975|nr:helix-turn-helix transcriptional regulator [Acidovorax carolinensis]
MNWIDEIRKLRDERQLSDAQTAAELGVSKQFLSDVLSGKKQLSNKIKLKIWSRRERDLDRESLLAFLPSKVAEQLLEIDIAREKRRADALLGGGGGAKDWVSDIITLRDERGLNNTEFAAELGISQPFLSDVLNRKKAVSWPLKIAIWSRKNYDLSRDSLLNLLPEDLSAELKEIDRERGRRRAAKIAEKNKPR